MHARTRLAATVLLIPFVCASAPTPRVALRPPSALRAGVEEARRELETRFDIPPSARPIAASATGLEEAAHPGPPAPAEWPLREFTDTVRAQMRRQDREGEKHSALRHWLKAQLWMPNGRPWIGTLIQWINRYPDQWHSLHVPAQGDLLRIATASLRDKPIDDPQRIAFQEVLWKLIAEEPSISIRCGAALDYASLTEPQRWPADREQQFPEIVQALAAGSSPESWVKEDDIKKLFQALAYLGTRKTIDMMHRLVAQGRYTPEITKVHRGTKYRPRHQEKVRYLRFWWEGAWWELNGPDGTLVKPSSGQGPTRVLSRAEDRQQSWKIWMRLAVSPDALSEFIEYPDQWRWLSLATVAKPVRHVVLRARAEADLAARQTSATSSASPRAAGMEERTQANVGVATEWSLWELQGTLRDHAGGTTLNQVRRWLWGQLQPGGRSWINALIMWVRDDPHDWAALFVPTRQSLLRVASTSPIADPVQRAALQEILWKVMTEDGPLSVRCAAARGYAALTEPLAWPADREQFPKLIEALSSHLSLEPEDAEDLMHALAYRGTQGAITIMRSLIARGRYTPTVKDVAGSQYHGQRYLQFQWKGRSWRLRAPTGVLYHQPHPGGAWHTLPLDTHRGQKIYASIWAGLATSPDAVSEFLNFPDRWDAFPVETVARPAAYVITRGRRAFEASRPQIETAVAHDLATLCDRIAASTNATPVVVLEGSFVNRYIPALAALGEQLAAHPDLGRTFDRLYFVSRDARLAQRHPNNTLPTMRDVFSRLNGRNLIRLRQAGEPPPKDFLSFDIGPRDVEPAGPEPLAQVFDILALTAESPWEELQRIQLPSTPSPEARKLAEDLMQLAKHIPPPEPVRAAGMEESADPEVVERLYDQAVEQANAAAALVDLRRQLPNEQVGLVAALVRRWQREREAQGSASGWVAIIGVALTGFLDAIVGYDGRDITEETRQTAQAWLREIQRVSHPAIESAANAIRRDLLGMWRLEKSAAPSFETDADLLTAAEHARDTQDIQPFLDWAKNRAAARGELANAIGLLELYASNDGLDPYRDRSLFEMVLSSALPDNPLPYGLVIVAQHLGPDVARHLIDLLIVRADASEPIQDNWWIGFENVHSRPRAAMVMQVISGLCSKWIDGGPAAMEQVYGTHDPIEILDRRAREYDGWIPGVSREQFGRAAHAVKLEVEFNLLGKLLFKGTPMIPIGVVYTLRADAFRAGDGDEREGLVNTFLANHVISGASREDVRAMLRDLVRRDAALAQLGAGLEEAGLRVKERYLTSAAAIAAHSELAESLGGASPDTQVLVVPQFMIFLTEKAMDHDKTFRLLQEFVKRDIPYEFFDPNDLPKTDALILGNNERRPRGLASTIPFLDLALQPRLTPMTLFTLLKAALPASDRQAIREITGLALLDNGDLALFV